MSFRYSIKSPPPCANNLKPNSNNQCDHMTSPHWTRLQWLAQIQRNPHNHWNFIFFLNSNIAFTRIPQISCSFGGATMFVVRDALSYHSLQYDKLLACNKTLLKQPLYPSFPSSQNIQSLWTWVLVAFLFSRYPSPSQFLIQKFIEILHSSFHRVCVLPKLVEHQSFIGTKVD